MRREGPPLPVLTRRLAEVPLEFLAEPRIGDAGQVHVAAVLHDLFALLRHSQAAAGLDGFDVPVPGDRNRLAIALLSAWLFADQWFRDAELEGDELVEFFAQVPRELGAQVAARTFTTDPDRREELARLALARVGYRPAGETRAQAEDRLASLSSTERRRVLQAAKVAERRAREIRARLARQAAEESADKWTRE